MTIGYDGRWQSGGIGRFAREVVTRLERGGSRICLLEVTGRIASPISPLLLARSISRAQMDVFWSPGFMPPWRSYCPTVVTIHDLIHRQYGGAARRFYYDSVIRPLLRRVMAIVTVSEHSQTDIAEWLGARHPPIHVVGNGVSNAFVREGERLRLGVPYVLYCGNHRSHKNLPRMVEAFALSAGCARLVLAMTGGPDESVNALARQFGVWNRVLWLGQLDEMQLAKAYRGATALLMTSLIEGFGLPVVEAMACGTPVVCSSTTSLGEVAGDAACLVDPTDVCSIATGIKGVVASAGLRKTLRERGLARASLFRWDDVATRVLAVLEEAART